MPFIGVVWVQLLQLVGEGVNIFVREFSGRRRREEAQTFPGFQFETRYLVSYFQWQTPHDVQHVQRPAALRNENYKGETSNNQHQTPNVQVNARRANHSMFDVRCWMFSFCVSASLVAPKSDGGGWRLGV
jgi:hypothetical protein